MNKKFVAAPENRLKRNYWSSSEENFIFVKSIGEREEFGEKNSTSKLKLII